MLPTPRKGFAPPVLQSQQWPDLDDDEGWQDMPVVRSDDNKLGLDEEDQQRYHYKAPLRFTAHEDPGTTSPTATTGNATGTHLELDADTLITDSWREKALQDESDYTRLRLDEDNESEETHMRTKYLFNEDKAMTPLSQMQATKELLTEGQRIAYVGLCQLIARRMVRNAGRGWEGSSAKVKGKGKAEVPVVESAHIWMLKIMARLYQHMELERDEQRMIETLADHGVDAADLVPALMTTHTVKNPEYDPLAKEKAEAHEAARVIMSGEEHKADEDDETLPPPYLTSSLTEPAAESSIASSSSPPVTPRPARTFSTSPTNSKARNPFGDDDDDDGPDLPPTPSSSSSRRTITRPSPSRLSSFSSLQVDDDDDGDIGRSASPTKTRTPTVKSPSKTETLPSDIDTPIDSPAPLHDPDKTPHPESFSTLPHQVDGDLPPELAPLPSLPGVSTSLSNTDEVVTLDIRWTVLCDLFLVLIADSVYDARSRTFLEHVAEALGFDWLDVVRFENRVTDALEIQEGMEKTEQVELIEGRRKGALRKRYALMGAAAVGGGLVIGLSAGLLAPVIGAGLVGALATVGVTGGTGFLAGVGGAAMITTGGVLTGANIAGRGMARRTREVRRFELKPLHNNKRVSCYITVGGFMVSVVDDVRLPFSVMDPIIGDVFSVLWEPEMMSEMGSALKILTSEILTQVGQQILQATVMTALMSALQWPMILTKLGYLIDNPWSNALDRSKAAGLVLADTILHRHAGVRPISLIGYSLGARAIFYALVELARLKAYGLVQDVFIFGATVTASKQKWLDARSAVGGRIVNGYATNDWILGYLFRMTSGGLNTVAGLRPVEIVAGLENVDVTDVITGHMSYRTCMPLLLAKVGLPVTADYFDEPDDPETDMSVQERTIVNEGDEEVKKSRKKILGIFPARAKSKVTSGTTTPRSNTPRPSESSPPRPDDDNEDDLPPREEEAGLGQQKMNGPGGISTDSLAEEAEVKAIAKTAGFDFKAISKELGKDINVAALKMPAEPTRDMTPPSSAPPLERSGSAPPPPPVKVNVLPPEELLAPMTRSASYAEPIRSFEEDDGDISTSTNGTPSSSAHVMEMPSWDQPSRMSPPLSSSSIKTPNFGWGGSGSASTLSLRAAPPARPHPPEFAMSPFAGQGMIGVDPWGSKKEEDLATKNPW